MFLLASAKRQPAERGQGIRVILPAVSPREQNFFAFFMNLL